VDLIAASFAHYRMVFRRSSTTFCLSKDSGNFHSIYSRCSTKKKKINDVVSCDQSRFLHRVHVAFGVPPQPPCSVRTRISSQGGEVAVVFS